MLKRILCVDDDAAILEAFKRQFHKHFEIQTALGPELGLQAVSIDGPFAVVVSDLRMPLMSGIEFLAHVRQSDPDTIRVMLTGDADLTAAVAAVNEGKVFQFLIKPCPSEMIARALYSALEQYRLLSAERELLEETVRGSIGVMSEILSLVNPAAFSRAQRIRRYVEHMAQRLKLPDRWQYELAAMLSQIGCVTVPPEVLQKATGNGSLTKVEKQILSAQAGVGRDLLAKIPRLEKVAEMVAHQRESWGDSSGLPDFVRTGAHLLRVASDLDAEVMRGNSPDSALAQMLKSREYNQTIVGTLQRLQVEEAKSETQLVKLSQLRPKMMINATVYSNTGMVLMSSGQQVTDSAIARLKSFASLFGIVEPISVIVADPRVPVPAANGRPPAA
jgi:response regulator RpfG family c-di-GMP phosphodiesterase